MANSIETGVQDRIKYELKPYYKFLMMRLYPQLMRVVAPFSRHRCLPDFLIIGAAKSGTTSLFHYISQHPGIATPSVKEVNYFSNARNFPYGEDWYRAHFPTKKHIDNLSLKLGYPARTGEATPSMNINSYAINAHALVPEAKIVIILRNPVDRAYSQYQHQVRKIPGEKLSFWDAIQKEAERTSEDLVKNLCDPNNVGHDLRRYGYTHRSKYIDQIEHWLHYFRKDQLMIVNFAAFRDDPELICNSICRFIGLPPYRLTIAAPLNVGRYRERMEERCRDYLIDIFRPYNRRLFDFLGEDWGWPS